MALEIANCVILAIFCAISAEGSISLRASGRLYCDGTPAYALVQIYDSDFWSGDDFIAENLTKPSGDFDVHGTYEMGSLEITVDPYIKILTKCHAEPGKLRTFKKLFPQSSYSVFTKSFTRNFGTLDMDEKPLKDESSVPGTLPPRI